MRPPPLPGRARGGPGEGRPGIRLAVSLAACDQPRLGQAEGGGGSRIAVASSYGPGDQESELIGWLAGLESGLAAWPFRPALTGASMACLRAGSPPRLAAPAEGSSGLAPRTLGEDQPDPYLPERKC
jgi:hypothetical protein